MSIDLLEALVSGMSGVSQGNREYDALRIAQQQFHALGGQGSEFAQVIGENPKGASAWAQQFGGLGKLYQTMKQQQDIEAYGNAIQNSPMMGQYDMDPNVLRAAMQAGEPIGTWIQGAMQARSQAASAARQEQNQSLQERRFDEQQRMNDVRERYMMGSLAARGGGEGEVIPPPLDPAATERGGIWAMQNRPISKQMQMFVRQENKALSDAYGDVALASRGQQQLEGFERAGSASDRIGILYNFIKSLDPGSAVREGEISLSREAVPGIAKMFDLPLNKFKHGYIITDDLAKQIVATSRSAARVTGSSYMERENKLYDRLASMGVHPQNIGTTRLTESDQRLIFGDPSSTVSQNLPPARSDAGAPSDLPPGAKATATAEDGTVSFVMPNGRTGKWRP